MKNRGFWKDGVKISFKAVNSLALMMTAGTAQSACFWIFHQPEFPAEADRFRKRKKNFKQIKE